MVNKLKKLLAKLAYMRAGHASRSNDDFDSFPPRHGCAVYWVGHSLMQQTQECEAGPQNLFSLFNGFAAEKQFECEMYDHTLFGAPLSLQWRGQTHSYQRTAEEMKEKRERFEREVKNYDTFVLTEVVPVKNVFEVEYSAYYLKQYYDTICSQNPNARIYLYESWDYLFEGRPPEEIDRRCWLEAMSQQRYYWEWLADAASTGYAVSPEPSKQCKTLLLGTASFTRNQSGAPIYLVPVGQVYMKLYTTLDRFPATYVKPDGASLKFHDLFTNPYVVHETEESVRLVDENMPLDDIHPSIFGIYLVALVHFATLYGQNPLGLSAPKEVGETLANALQRLVWEVVTADPRSGVESD